MSVESWRPVDNWRLGPTLVAFILAGLITLANGMVLFAILRPRNTKLLRTPTNLMVASLACTDLLVGLVTIPTSLVTIHGLPSNFSACFVMQIASFLPVKVSVFGYLVLSIERFLAVKYPFRYINWCTKMNAKIAIGVTWLAGVLFMCCVLYRIEDVKVIAAGGNMTRCNFVTAFSMEFIVYVHFWATNMPCAIAIIILYSLILLEVKTILSSNRQLIKNVPHRNFLPLEAYRKSEAKASVRCGLLIGAFLLCQIPISGTTSLTLWFGFSCTSCRPLFLCLMLGNSLINPALYSITNRDLKLEMQRMFICLKLLSTFRDPLNVVQQEHGKRRKSENFLLSEMKILKQFQPVNTNPTSRTGSSLPSIDTQLGSQPLLSDTKMASWKVIQSPCTPEPGATGHIDRAVQQKKECDDQLNEGNCTKTGHKQDNFQMPHTKSNADDLRSCQATNSNFSCDDNMPEEVIQNGRVSESQPEEVIQNGRVSES